MNFDGLLQRALALHQAGKLAEAEPLYHQLMRIAPQDWRGPHFLGVVRAQQGRNDEALMLMDRALKLNPEAPEILSNYANVLRALGRMKEALSYYDRALALKPDYAAVFNRRALLLRDMGQLQEALAAAAQALQLRPNDLEALNTRGIVLYDMKDYEAALASYDLALVSGRNSPDTLNNRSLALKALKRPDEALRSVEDALQLRPAFPEAWNNRGIILFELKRIGDAIASYEQALQLRPNYAEAYNNRAVAHWSLRRFQESLSDCERAILLKSDFADAYYNRGNALAELNQPAEALASYERALSIDPSHPNAMSGLANAAMTIGDWARTKELAPKLKAAVLDGSSVIQPFVVMGYWDDNQLQLHCSQNYVRQAGPGRLAPLCNAQRYHHDKIRIAYLSADFQQHVTAALTVEMFERHNREQFEVIAISFGLDDSSAMRQRLIKAFDHFHDARQMSDKEVAQLIRRLEVDIAVDLGGHTSGARPWVLAHRPAPVQAKYMGYPGTSGSDFIDYLIADRTVVPKDQEPFFSERIAILPDTLWVTDTRRMVLAAPRRSEVGLPQDGFVFCCFNHNWKITAPIFDIWMRLLRQTEGSVLWLLEGNASIRNNLCKEAVARGVLPERLIFAPRTTPENHLARQQLADLFLDTLPYNAHTTASDALWVGLPIVTTPGHSFPARVAASILRAAELPELIAEDLVAYEALAMKLAHQPALLGAIRQKLLDNKCRVALFNTEQFTRNLELQYRKMLEAM